METEDISTKSPVVSKPKPVGLTNSPQPIIDANPKSEDELTEAKTNSHENDDVTLNKPTEDAPITEDKNEIESGENKQLHEPKPDKQQGRKRKASEMKSLNENSLEDPLSKDRIGLKDDAPHEEKENKLVEKPNDDGMSLELKEMKDLDTQTLGKGKRARIPNKRYSDFPLKSSRSSQPEFMEVDEKIKTGLENGETKEIVDGEVGSNPDLTLKDDASEKSSLGSPNVVVKTNVSLRANRTASPSTPGMKKSKLPLDLTNPNYLKPFQFGWKRELVYRATNDATSSKRNGDIYYYTPNGKKVRSMREVSENLKNKELTLDDFTFFKEPLGLDDPEKEIIRDAKIKSAISTPSIVKKSTPKPTRTPKVSSPKSTPTDSPAEVKPKNSPRKAAFKIKLPSRGGAQNKSKTEKKSNKNDSDMDIGTYPPNWTSPITKKANKTANKNKRKKPKLSGTVHPHAGPEVEDAKFMDSYLQNVAYGYNTLLYVFQYLKMQDLLRASCVCSMWRDIASHPMLWRTVRMKNSQIHSFEGLADALEKHGTVHLDLRKMLLPSTSNDEIWLEFSRAIKKVDSLRKIELCRCPATVVEQLALSNPKLEVINSVTIKCESMSLAPLVFLKNLQELRLKSTAGFSLTSDLTALSDLKQLKHLSLTSIKELNKLNINVIADLRNLESLELGECTDFPKTFGSEILTRLSKLEKLRLEKGQGNCYTFEVLEAVKNMPHLYQLELVNFDIKPGFDLALGACPNIKKLLIIPTYISQSATTNHMVLGGVLRLQSTLSQFVWGVTLELLRVTELFVDQCEEDKEKKEKRPMSNGDSIPVLKPVPLAREGMAAEILPAQEPPQVEILPLPNLQKLLLSSLPTTRVKILKIPFHATWRQSIHDSVN